MGILIVSHNNLHLTKKAVASALAQDTPQEVLVIDNASTDGTIQWLRSKVGIHYLEMIKQESLASCWNLGLCTLWCNDPAPVLVLNNDVEIRPDMYSLLHKYYTSRKGPAMVTGVSVRDRDKMYPPYDQQESPHPDFSCFLISQAIFHVVGHFDEEYYPAYCEDNDYHVRMHRAGVSAVSINIPFLHHGAQTLVTASAAEAARIRKGADRCRERFKSKYGCLPGTPEYSKLFA